jgi:hypothetical protein
MRVVLLMTMIQRRGRVMIMAVGMEVMEAIVTSTMSQ